MAAGEGDAPDWRDAAAYAPLFQADRSLSAWEWLRRDPGYRAAAERALEAGSRFDPGDPAQAPERWGLHAFERPALAVPGARPVWCAGVHPFVLNVDACPPHGGDAFDLQRFDTLSTLVTAGDGCEHLLLSDGLRPLRIDVLQGSLKDGRVQLRYRLAGFAAAERPILTLRRFLALWRTGRFPTGLYPAAARAGRLVLMLRAYDALMSGATQREIAVELLSGEAGEERWRVRAPSVRSRVQRLVRQARHMAAGGYVELLA